MEAVKTENGVLYNGATVPVLCLDLDGTVRYNKNDPNGFINKPEDIALYDGVEAKLWEYRDKGYLILGISNQGGVAFGHKTPEVVDAEVDAMLDIFERDPFDIVKCCLHHENGTKFPWNRRSLLRKPNIGMLVLMEMEAFKSGYLIDWDNSLFVGDRPEDEQCAKNAGIPFQWANEFFGR